MGFDYRRFFEGINIKAKSLLANDTLGDLEVSSSNSKIYFHNGILNSPLLTEDSINNQTISGVTLHNSFFDTLTGVPGSTATVRSNTNQNLVLQAQGTGDIIISGSTATINGNALIDLNATEIDLGDFTVIGSTLTGGASATTVLRSNTNRDLTIQAQGTGDLTLAGENITENASVLLDLNAPQINVGEFTVTNSTLLGSASSTAIVRSGSNRDLSLEAQGSGNIVFKTNAVTKLTLENDGDLIPNPDNTNDLGSASNRFNNAFLGGQARISSTTAQVVLGNTNTITLNAPAPSASRVYRMPDVGANADFLFTEGSQTINGVKTINDNLQFKNQGSTPSNPSTGILRVYSKNDNNLYTLDSGGNETQIGGSGSQNLNVVSKSASYVAMTTDDVILCDASGGSFTITLPTAIGNSGKEFIIKKIDNTFNSVTIATVLSQSIDKVGGGTSLNTLNEAISNISDNVNWQLRSRVVPSNWVPFSLTIGASGSPPTKGTTATDLAVWRRVGDSIEINYWYDQNGSGANGSGVYLFPIPPGLVFDNTKSPPGGSTIRRYIVGAGEIITDEAGGNSGTLQVFIWNTNHVALIVHYNPNAGGNTITDNVGDSFKLGNGTNISWGFNYKVPISGWKG